MFLRYGADEEGRKARFLLIDFIIKSPVDGILGNNNIFLGILIK